MKLKLDDAGHVVVQDGKPVFIHEDGKEIAFDAPATVATITRLNGEAKGHREAKEVAELKLKGFEGIEDPAAAAAALETVKNLGSGELTTAAKVQEIKDAAKRAAEEQVAAAQRAGAERLKEAEGTIAKLTGDLYDEKIGGSFGRSKFVTDKLAVPPDMVQATFGKAFKMEDGRPVAYGPDGNKIYSSARPGEIADFDEALEFLVERYPHKDNILKGTGAQGSGAQGNQGGGNSKVMKRTDFDALDAKERAAKMAQTGFQLVE